MSEKSNNIIDDKPEAKVEYRNYVLAEWKHAFGDTYIWNPKSHHDTVEDAINHASFHAVSSVFKADDWRFQPEGKSEPEFIIFQDIVYN